MNFFESQLRAILGNQVAFEDAKYIGRACIASLEGGIKLKAEFTIIKTADHYEALKLTAINPTDGEVDRLTLRFDDYIQPQMIGGGALVPYIWTYDGQTKWYGRPLIADKAALGDAAQEYAELFEQQNDMGISM